LIADEPALCACVLLPPDVECESHNYL
jgi:hypothetical protein